MKIIDGKNAVLGRLASYVAKELLKGEEIVIVNSEEIIITGNKRNIKEEFEEKRKKVGSTQKGQKVSRIDIKMVKKAIRGMLPNYRKGRGKDALKRVKCYMGIPEKFKDVKKIVAGKEKSNKFVKIKDISQ